MNEPLFVMLLYIQFAIEECPEAAEIVALQHQLMRCFVVVEKGD